MKLSGNISGTKKKKNQEKSPLRVINRSENKGSHFKRRKL